MLSEEDTTEGRSNETRKEGTSALSLLYCFLPQNCCILYIWRHNNINNEGLEEMNMSNY